MSDPKKRRKEHNPSLQTFEVFCDVLRLRSFSRAAEEAGITQSAVSQLVAHLEKELGVRLIDRNQRPLVPTPEGQLYHQGCRDLLHSYRGLLERVRRRRVSAGGKLRIVSIYSVGLHTVSGLVAAFLHENPGSNLRLEYCHPSRVYSAVLEGEAEIGVISYPRHQRRLEVIDWIEEEMVLACPPNHRLAERKDVRLADLDGEAFIAFDNDLVIRREIDRALRHEQAAVDVLGEFDNIETIKQALVISRAVSILPRPSIAIEVERGSLVEVPLVDGGLARPVGIVHRKKTLTPTAEGFIQSMIAAAGSLSGATPKEKAV